MLNALLFSFILGIAGGRAYYVIQHHQFYTEFPAQIFAMWKGGFASMGAIVGSCTGAIIYLVIRKIPVWKFADCCAPAIALGIFLTRIGCFLNGCCFGKVSKVPWAVRFPQGSQPYMFQLYSGKIDASSVLSLPVHPVQLYYSLAGLGLFIMLVFFRKHRKTDGTMFLIFAFFYVTCHFFFDFFRETLKARSGQILTATQLICLAFLMVIILLMALRFIGKKNMSNIQFQQV
jgi:phosphatidylglycerol:prolipoprotein diacylglycerol transferase